MKDHGAPHPVELLRDERGVYGIGVSELTRSAARRARGRAK